MPSKWTPEAEAKLLIGAIKHCDVKPPADFFESIAATIGGDTNANGCSQKFHKLKREADSILNATSGSDDVATATTTNDTPNTPATSVGGRKKRAPATATPKKTLAGATKGRKRKAAALADDDDGEKELDIDGIVETPVTPSKKSRKAKAATKQGKVDGSENGAVRVASDEDLVQTGGAGAGAEDEV